jgi:hypothetical protein
MPDYGLAYSLAMSWSSMLAGFSSAMWPLMRYRREALSEAAAAPLADSSEAADTGIGAAAAARQRVGATDPQAEDDRDYEAVVRLNV